MWYAVYEIATGELKSQGSVVAPDNVLSAKGWTKKEFTDPPASNMMWNPATLEFDLPAPAEIPTWTIADFLDKFTSAERVAIRAAAKTNDTLADRLEMIKLVGQFRADHPKLEPFLTYLVGQGLLTTQRATEIGTY